MKILIVLTIGLFTLIILGTAYFFLSNGNHLRGSVKPSKDGNTYLIVADDNGGGCGPIKVDGVQWPHAINEAGSIKPGIHKIACGGEIEFEIPVGTTFRFDYWGP